jgi:hypothetical protein
MVITTHSFGEDVGSNDITTFLIARKEFSKEVEPDILLVDLNRKYPLLES